MYTFSLIALLASFSSQPLDTVEYIDYHKVQINGKIPFLSQPQKLIAIFGKPDSITQDSSECGTWFEEYKFKTFHWNNTHFQNVGDTTIIDDLDLRNGKFWMSSPSIVLNNKITFATIEKVFPESCKQAYNWQEPKSKLIYKNVRIASEPIADDYWVLRFLDGVLVHIHYHVPC